MSQSRRCLMKRTPSLHFTRPILVSRYQIGNVIFDYSLQSPIQLKSIREAAEWIWTQKQLGLQNGLVLAVPIPKQDAADGSRIEQAIQQALKEADMFGITGKAATPFLLRRVAELTDGASLRASTIPKSISTDYRYCLGSQQYSRRLPSCERIGKAED